MNPQYNPYEVVVNYDYSEWFNNFFTETSHIDNKKFWLKKYQKDVHKLKGIEKFNLQSKIIKLKTEIKNHKKLFPEEYI